MKERLKQVILKHAHKICAIAVSVASIAPVCCRGNWYQPDEPDGIKEFVGKKGLKNCR